MRLSAFRSIESRHGVDEPGYEIPSDEVAEAPGWDRDPPATADGVELLVSTVFPIGGMGFAIWRFARGDIGPGLADLLCTAVGCVLVVIILLASS